MTHKRYFIRSFEGETQELTHTKYLANLKKQFDFKDKNTFNRMLEVMDLKYIVCGTTHLFWVGQIMQFKLEKLQQIEVYCTPEDLRELAKTMEHEYKDGDSSYRAYFEKKKFAVVFCIDIDRMDSQQNVKDVMERCKKK